MDVSPGNKSDSDPIPILSVKVTGSALNLDESPVNNSDSDLISILSLKFKKCLALHGISAPSADFITR